MNGKVQPGEFGRAFGFDYDSEVDVTTHPAPVVEMPRATKTLPCMKCGKEMLVAERCVMACCADCSKNMGQKR